MYIEVHQALSSSGQLACSHVETEVHRLCQGPSKFFTCNEDLKSTIVGCCACLQAAALQVAHPAYCCRMQVLNLEDERRHLTPAHMSTFRALFTPCMHPKSVPLIIACCRPQGP